MSNWTRNNRAHGFTYLALRTLDHVPKGFAAAGDKKMKELGHWIPGSSTEDRKRAAESTASVMHNIFKLNFEATYESGFNKVKSVGAMADVLQNANKKVTGLADAADLCFLFRGENLDV